MGLLTAAALHAASMGAQVLVPEHGRTWTVWPVPCLRALAVACARGPSPGVGDTNTDIGTPRSSSAVFTDPNERGKGHVITEEDWADMATMTAFPYNYAKTQVRRRRKAGAAAHPIHHPLPLGSPPAHNEPSGSGLETIQALN